MNVEVSGTSRAVEAGTMLQHLIEAVAGSARGTAAVVDGHVVPRSQWPIFEVRPGHSIELVTAVQGG